MMVCPKKFTTTRNDTPNHRNSKTSLHVDLFKIALCPDMIGSDVDFKLLVGHGFNEMVLPLIWLSIEGVDVLLGQTCSSFVGQGFQLRVGHEMLRSSHSLAGSKWLVTL